MKIIKNIKKSLKLKKISFLDINLSTIVAPIIDPILFKLVKISIGISLAAIEPIMNEEK